MRRISLISALKRRKRQDELLGLSIGPDGIAYARIRRQEPLPPQILDCAFYPLETNQSTEDLLAKLTQQHQLRQIPASLVLQQREFSLLLIEAPLVEPAERKSAARWRIRDLIDFDIDQAVIDVFDLPESSTRGRQPMMYAVAAPIQTIRQYVDRAYQSDIKLAYIDIPELVQRNITAMLPEDPQGIVFLNLMPQRGLLTLTCKGTLYLARDFEFGLEQLPLLSTTEETGVLSLEENESGLHPATQRTLDTILLEIQRSLDYYESHFGQAPISSLVIAPLPYEIPGMLTYIAANTGLKVSNLDINHILQTTTPMNTELQNRCLGAIGAALRNTQDTQEALQP